MQTFNELRTTVSYSLFKNVARTPVHEKNITHCIRKDKHITSFFFPVTLSNLSSDLSCNVIACLICSALGFYISKISPDIWSGRLGISSTFHIMFLKCWSIVLWESVFLLILHLTLVVINLLGGRILCFLTTYCFLFYNHFSCMLQPFMGPRYPGPRGPGGVRMPNMGSEFNGVRTYIWPVWRIA